MSREELEAVVAALQGIQQEIRELRQALKPDLPTAADFEIRSPMRKEIYGN